MVAAVVPAVATIAAVCGNPAPETVSEEPAGVSYMPQGDIARLRLEVIEDAITCGGTAEVQVWLDDLPRETVLGPPPKNHFGEVGPNWPPAPLTTGLTAFQFHLRYDPAVVWVVDKSDVSVSPDLNSAPPATTDPRNFAAAARLDNHDGDLFAGGVAIGLAMTADPASVPPGGIKPPAGIDPLDAGEPILLMTVTLTPVGQGRTPLTLDEVELFLDHDHFFAPVEAEQAQLSVGGGVCPRFNTPTPLTTPTVIAPSPTPIPQVTTVPVTPQPAAGIRDDCPIDWAVVDHERFSFCYPASMGAYRAPWASGVTYGLLSDELYISFVEGDVPHDLASRGCANGEPIRLSSNSTEVAGCLWHTRELGDDFEKLAFSFESGGRYFSAYAMYKLPEFAGSRVTAERIFETIAVK